jgi:hypothetical protein
MFRSKFVSMVPTTCLLNKHEDLIDYVGKKKLIAKDSKSCTQRANAASFYIIDTSQPALDGVSRYLDCTGADSAALDLFLRLGCAPFSAAWL